MIEDRCIAWQLGGRRRMLVAGLIAIAITALAPAAAGAALVPAVGSPLAVGAKPWEANAADVNGDGHQDLLVTNYDDDSVSVLLGSGTGRFTPEAGSPIAVGDTPIATAVGHLDGDARLDVAVTTSADRLTILHRKADNTGFVAQPAGPAVPDQLRYGVAAEDVDGDGRDDLVVSNLGASTVSVLEQQPDGSFADATGSPFAAGAAPAGLATGDVDGDGDPDIAVVSNGQDFVTILSNGPAGFAAQGSPIPVGDAPTRITASDLVGDARPELAIANSGDDSVTILVRNAENDGFETAAGSPAAAGDKPYDVAAADFDLDGTRELVVSNEIDGTLTVLAGTPAAGYAPALDSPLRADAAPLGLVVRDFDANGRPDVAVARYNDDSVAVRLNDPATPLPPAPLPGCTPPTAGRVALWRAEGSPGDSAGAHDATMRNGAGFGPGAVGTAFALPGDSDHLSVPDAADLDITGDLTLDAWVRIDDENFGATTSPTGVGGDRIILWKVALDRYASFALWIEADAPNSAATAPLGFFHGDNTVAGNRTHSDDLAWEQDRWYHVAVTRTGKTIAFYRDGVAVGGGTLTDAPTSTPLTPVVLGGAPVGADLFNPLKGSLDEAAVWSRALSAAEVAAIRAAGIGDCHVAPPPPPPPPPPEPPRNVTRPAIVDARECPTTLGGGPCQTIPNTYRCDPGTWSGRDESRPYAFTWERMTKDSAYVDGYRPTPVATGETFRASSATTLGLDPARWLFRCRVEAFGPGGSASAVSDRRQLQPAYEPDAGPQNPAVDVRVTGIEVTQGIQPAGCTGCIGVLPSREQATLSQPATVDYGAKGVRLAAGKWTTARVFADYRLAGGVATSPLAGVTARLEVYDSAGNRISTLTPDSSPPSVPPAPADGRAFVTHAQRAGTQIAFTFLIPWQETMHQALSLRAIVNPAKSGLAPLKQCAGCNANIFTLQGIPFARTEQVRVRPVRISSNGRASGETVQDMYAAAQELMPGYVQYFPYPSSVLVVPADKHKAVAAVAQWAADSRFATTDMPMGIFKREVDKDYNSLNGLSGVQVDENVVSEGELRFGIRSAAIAGDDRPITSVAHELGHMLGLPHADTMCGGNSDKQVGVANPPSNVTGSILGLGLDPRASRALPRLFTDAAGTDFFDFMSYCGSDDLEGLHWIGRSNWNTLLARNAPAEALPRSVARSAAAGRVRVAATRRPLRVIATESAAGVAEVFSISPGQDARVPADASSPYRVELRDAAGQVVSSVTPAVQALEAEGEAPARLLTATLEFAPSARELVIRKGDQIVARRSRSARPPTAGLVAPRAGAIGGGATTVRWRASDADGDKLRTTIDYSRDGGRSWSVVATDVAGRSARIAARALGASGNARIRIRVSDGFDAAIVVSGRLRSRGAPPLVRIDSRTRRARSDQLVLLQGSAFDDADRPLTGRRLRWLDGTRVLGRGERISVQGLRPGTRAIKLVAIDARGRSATAVQRIRVAAVRPQFLLFDAPDTVRRSARSVRIRVASTVPATLRIAGRRFLVGRTPRRVSVPIARGTRALALPVRLVAFGLLTRGTYRARRG